MCHFRQFYRVLTPPPRVTSLWFQLRVSFSTFHCAASTLLIEAFYERHLFVFANFTSRIQHETMTFVCMCVEGYVCVGLCTVYLYFGTWCHCCLARYKCLTALELTDESTEPDPGVTSGCKPLNTNFTTCYQHCLISLAPLWLSCHCLFHPSIGSLEAVSSCCNYCVSTSGFCTECHFLFCFL